MPGSPEPGPGLASFMFANLSQLHTALDRVYKLAMSLPEAPLDRFKAKTSNLPRTTEAERLVIVGTVLHAARDERHWKKRL